MKCSKCNEELNPKWKLCPFCGTQVPLTAKPFDEYLAELVKSNTSAIFKAENGTRLEKIMNEWPESYADNRDIIKLLMIKKIPSKLCSALEESDNEKNKVVQDSANVLIDKFGINSETASKMISLITNAIGLKATVAVGNGMGTFRDPRDGQIYKTCKIGNQVWLAENLKYDCGEGCYVYDANYKYLDKYGYMYNLHALQKAVPKGWHLPTVEEVKTMESFIIKSKRCKSAIPHLLSRSWPEWKSFCEEIDRDCQLDEKSADFYGFSALPGGHRSGWIFGISGISRDSRWWLKQTGQKDKNGFYNAAWEIDAQASNPYIHFDGSRDKSYLDSLYQYIRLIKD